MGTLFHQTPRKHPDEQDFEKLEHFVKQYKDIAKRYNITIKDVIEVANVMREYDKLHYQINDRDRFDEQLSGFGELFKEFIDKQEETHEISED